MILHKLLTLTTLITLSTGLYGETEIERVEKQLNPFVEKTLVGETEVTASFDEQGTIRFKDSHHGFQIQIPDDWELEEGFSDEFLDFVFVGVSPEEGPQDPFIENMNVLVEELNDGIGLEQYFMWNLQGLIQELTNLKVHEKVNVTVNGMKMARIVYSWDLNNQRTATYQYIFVKDNRGYVITFSAEPKKFAEIRNMFDAVAVSFSFRK